MLHVQFILPELANPCTAGHIAHTLSKLSQSPPTPFLSVSAPTNIYAISITPLISLTITSFPLLITVPPEISVSIVGAHRPKK